MDPHVARRYTAVKMPAGTSMGKWIAGISGLSGLIQGRLRGRHAVMAKTTSNAVTVDEDAKVLHNMGYAQELTRRMGAFQNFAISFAIICIVAGGITAFPVALSSAGGAGVGLVWILGSIFALLVAAAMGQVASSYPTAGGIYHWSSLLGGRGYGWAAAWFNLLGLMFVVSSVNWGLYNLFRDLFLAQVLGWDVANWVPAGEFSTGWWYQTIFITCVTAAQALLNHYYLRLTTVLTDWSGYIIMATAVLLTLAMLAFAGSWDFSRLFTFRNFTGEAGGNVWPAATVGIYVFLLALLHVVYTITGFDASAHTSEETRNAQREVPKGMIRSVFWSFLFGYIMVCSFVLALPDQKDAAGNVTMDGVAAGAAQGWNAFNWLIAQVQMPGILRSVIIIGIVVSNFLCALAGLTSCSRMIYAFARDGGLPMSDLFKKIDPRLKTPGPAIWAGGVLSIIATLYGGAFLVLSTGCAVFLYLSYLMPIGAAVKSEMSGEWKEKGPFNLGGLSILVAALALIGCAILIYVGVQPPQEKVGYLIVLMIIALAGFWQSMEGRMPLGLAFAVLTAAAVWYFWKAPDSSFNIYAALATLAVMAVLVFLLQGKRFHGPPVGEEIKQRQAEIAAAEAAASKAAAAG
jgi:amino acid transporter